MPVVDGHDHRSGIGFSEHDDMLVRMKIKHDYPACALFRGGKCTCDEADNLCPKCGSEEWDEVYEPGRVTPSYRRCAYSACDHEWESENPPMPKTSKEKQEDYRARMALLGMKEVRGIYLPEALHPVIKEQAARLLEKQAKEDQRG